MKKLVFVIATIISLSNCIAQIKPVRLPKNDADKDAVNQGSKPISADAFNKDEKKFSPVVQLDESMVAATESILAKMKEVVNKANGFKDDKLAEVYNSTKVKGYYRNTNNVNGAIYYNPIRKKSVFIYGEIRKFFDSQGGSNSYIDYPVNDISNIKSGFDGQYGESASFEGACITVNSKRKLQAVFGAIYEKYRMLGGATSNLGFAISERAKYTATAYAQVFEGGMIITNNNAAYVIAGSIAKKYNYADCGLPLADVVTEKGNSKILFIVNTQRFEKNTIVSSTKTAACFVKNDIYKKWMTYGDAINNTCGLPTSDAVDNGAMTAQNFENGLMLLVNGKVTFVPDDSEKNTQDNNKIRQSTKLDVIKFAPVKIQ